MFSELNPGEVLCSACDGKGYYIQKNLPDKIYYFKELNIECPTCYGAGKLDWIEVVVGKRKPNLGVVFDFETEYLGTFTSEFDSTFNDRLLKDAAKNIVEQIDKDIIETITSKADHGTENRFESRRIGLSKM